MIQDTNSPYITGRLTKEGYSVTVGDRSRTIWRVLSLSFAGPLGEGYGLIVTTGGVGAEDKDRMVRPF